MTSASITDAERLARLRLARTESVGPVTYAALIERCGTALRALETLPDLSRRGGRSAPVSIPSIAEIEREMELGSRAGASLLAIGDLDFPRQLAALDPPPPILWIMGDATLLSRPAVAIVGARIASSGGQRFARQLASDLGEAGFLVVSGLARGIDGAAHEGSIKTGTAAVLGGGVDDVYPPEHAALHKRVGIEGCLVSESPMGHRAQAKDFPRRNRIISGLSLGVVVVEAELRSGSLITARLAGEQGRDVFAVPGSPLDPRARGTNDLIRQGAILCEGVEDVIRNLTPNHGVREPQGDLFTGAAPDEAALDREADKLRERVYALTSFTATPIDEIVRSLAAPASAVFAALVELSLAGRVDLLPGAMVARG